MEFASYIVPSIIFFGALIMLFSRRDTFTAFKSGVSDGIKTAISLAPVLIVITGGIMMIKSSGVTRFLASSLENFFDFLMIPSELLEFILLRPVSGSAAIVILKELFVEYGPDSLAGRCASVISGCGDTLIYIFAVYFACAKVKHTRHALPAAVITQIFSIFLSVWLVRVFL